MAVLKDNRKYQAMTVAEADDLFLRIARLKAAIDKETAAHKKKLADLELAHIEKITPLMNEMAALEAHLEAYISNHSEDYVDPRLHPVGLIGSYGIKTNPAKVELDNKGKDTVNFALVNGLEEELLRIDWKPDLRKIAKAISEGHNVPGATLVPAGDTVVISFKKGYAEALEA